MIHEKINAGKTAAGFAECASSCDKSRLFSNTKINQRVESTKQVETALKIHSRNSLNVLVHRKLLNTL